VSNDLRPKRASDIWTNRLWILAAVLGAASVVSTATIIHDTSRQRAALHSVVRSTAEQVVAVTGSHVEILAVEAFAPVMAWASPDPSNESAAAALARVARGVSRCKCRDTLGATEFFRYDVATRLLTRIAPTGAQVPADARSSVLEGVARRESDRVRTNSASAIHLTVGRELGDHAVLTIAQRDTVGVPSAIYGAVTNARLFAVALFNDAATRVSLVDSAGRLASLRTMGFLVAGPDSTTILATIDDTHPFRSSIRAGGPLDGLTITTALAADQIPIRTDISSDQRLHLGVLLVATVLVISFAVGSSRKELLLARARSDFIASVSHDLRMPLAQILIAGETLTLERERNGAERRQLSHAIVREARRLVSIVDNVLLFSRSGTKRPKPVLRPLFVDELFNDAIEAVGLAVEDAGQSIAMRAPTSLAVLGDRQLVRQALVNFVDNALKYGVRGQRIEIGAEQVSPTAVQLYVEDQGPGVPADERARVFEPYERLVRDRTSERTGSGLGLAVVREIALALNGRAWLDEASGGGTRAVIELPSAAHVGARAPSPAMT
jgi:signal transduction histidine kinase